MTNPYYFNDEKLKNGFESKLENQKINHAYYLFNIEPNFSYIGVETRYINKMLEEMAPIYARLLNQYKFIYHIIFAASFYKAIEDDRRSDEIELFINLNIKNNLTEIDINNLDVKSQLEHQIQI